MRFFGLFLLLVYYRVGAQSPTPAAARLASFEEKLALQTETPLHLEFRNIGPTIMGGRIVDLDVNPENPNEFYVAYASGGLWKTLNNGGSFEPLFDYQAAMTIGDIAIDWQHGEKIWIGTGESNSSRSSYSGVGILTSEDKGKTWQHKGLEESHHIGKLVLHPQNPQIAWAAAIGHLYSHNPERGVFKTTDGGKTWQKTLFVNDSTGAIDIILHPKNPDILYAATWERARTAWNFKGAGKGSGIYKTEDGGVNWQKISGGTGGLPDGALIGRMGLAIAANDPNVLYCVVDNQNLRAEKDEDSPDITQKQLRKISAHDFTSLPDDQLNEFLDYHSFPEKYNAKNIKEKIQSGKLKPADLADYISDANQDLFDTPIIGAELYCSKDAGKTWNKTHANYLDNIFYTYGYYFGRVEVSPLNSEEVYLLGVPILRSENGGKDFNSINQVQIHPDHHALWISPRQTGHILLGNDGGLALSYDKGATFILLNKIPVGQFYAINVDSATPYDVYGGLQDNGVWRGSSRNTPNPSWTSTGQYPFKELMEGDGMQIMIDPKERGTLYTGYQFGNYTRLEEKEGEYEENYISPQHELGEKPHRFNWQTPILLSRYNSQILYMGAHRLFRSMDKGEHFTPISPDLTTGAKVGNVPYGTITALDESAFKFGFLYVGTDDGQVHVTTNGGETWNNISAGLPEKLWVSRVIASRYNENKIYVALNGYRYDDVSPYLYVSENQGKTWEKIGLNLPLEPINVMREDPYHPHIIYVGTDNGLYISTDKGKHFTCLNNATLPFVAVHDLILHPQAHELVVGTHGRSIYVADVKYLQKMQDSLWAKPLHFFAPDTLTYSNNWGELGFDWMSKDTPTIQLHYYQKERQDLEWVLYSAKGVEVFRKKLPAQKGLTSFTYNLQISPQVAARLANEISDKTLHKQYKVADNSKWYLPPATYRIELVTPQHRASRTWVVKAPKKQKRELP